MTSNDDGFVRIDLAKKGVLSIRPVMNSVFRIRLHRQEDPDEPALIRYGILRNDWEPVEYSIDEDQDSLTIVTPESKLKIDRNDGRLTLMTPDDRVILRESEPPRSSRDSGFDAKFELQETEKLYGLGDETRDRIQKRGHRTQIWVRNVACYVPIPFLMSTGGWGILLNTTWRHFFDLGCREPNRLRFWSRQGELDYYLIMGESLPIILDRYTEIAGKPTLLPLWGYGLTFVCNQQANAREMLDDCLNFRREGIPCDLVGLEPGWMSKHYDYTVDKQWHPERFYIPHWAPRGPHTFLGAAERLGFKVSLWLCCDYDLSYAEEDAVPRKAEQVERHPDDFEQDEHFGHGPTLMDKITRRDQPWFEHLKKFVDQGVSAFKMDGALQVNEHPDRKWGNGMSDEEMHNLYPTLLNKQMSLGFQAHTGRRSMIYSSGGYTGIQRFSATWAGDTGGGPKPLVSMLNHGLSGHSNVSCDMDVFSPAGIHFGFLMSWSQVCSWAYWRHPWLLGDKLLPIFKFYARLRYRLLPYIYSMAHVANRTGMPIMRSMNLMFPNDPECENRLQQYMFGDSLLVGAFTDEIYLPEGRWIDYWSGKIYEGAGEIKCDVPQDRGGPLFIRSGAIIPYWDDMDYVGQKPVETLKLHVYPDGKSSFTLFEDDGVTLAYRDGAVALTQINCVDDGENIILTIAPRSGRYDGMPESRSFDVRIHAGRRPDKAQIDGDPDWIYDETDCTIKFSVTEDTERRRPVTAIFGFR